MSHRSAQILLLATLLIASAGATLSGCAGKKLLKMESPPESIQKELPKEVRDKFEVRETPETPETPSPTPTPTPRPKRKIRKRHPKHPVHAKKAKGPTPQPGPEASESEEPVEYPSRRPAKDPVWVGEKLTYDVTYFGMEAGELTLEAMPFKTINNRKVYHIHADAQSSSVFSLFYKLHDTVDTFFDYDGLFSDRFQLVLDESKQTRNDLELYDSDKGVTYYYNKWDRSDRHIDSKETKPIPRFPQDSLSALYFLRFIPLPDGRVVTYPVASEGNSWEAVVTVLRREFVDSPIGRVQAVVVKPEHKFHGILQKQGDSFIWLTDDDRRYVLRLEAHVKIGTVVAQLKSVEPGTPPQQQQGD